MKVSLIATLVLLCGLLPVALFARPYSPNPHNALNSSNNTASLNGTLAKWNDQKSRLKSVYKRFHAKVKNLASRHGQDRTHHIYHMKWDISSGVFERHQNWALLAQALYKKMVQNMANANATAEKFISMQPLESQQRFKQDWDTTHASLMSRYEQDMKNLKRIFGGDNPWEMILSRIDWIYRGIHQVMEEWKKPWTEYKERSVFGRAFAERLPVTYTLAEWNRSANVVVFSAYINIASVNKSANSYIFQNATNQARLQARFENAHAAHREKLIEDMRALDEIRNYQKAENEKVPTAYPWKSYYPVITTLKL